MANRKYLRRTFLKNSAVAGLGIGFAANATPNLIIGSSKDSGTPAILGGQPVRTKGWPKWPVWNPETDEKRVIKVLRSLQWSRNKVVSEFEEQWAKTIGAKRCLATTNGTNALIIAFNQLGVGAGDEVIVTPYTFIASIDAILINGAMPIFVDVNPATFQIDADKVEEKITSRTIAIEPVHILGLPVDIEKIMDIASRHNLFVVEDACQAWQAEVNNKKVGTFGNAGCFSFQNSKHLAVGEGGAIVSDEDEFMDRCFSFHNLGRPHGKVVGSGYVILGTKARWTEYQAAMGLAQLKRMDAENTRREINAKYLREKIKGIPGILPVELSPNVTRAVFHMFPFRYKKENFHGLSRNVFIKALSAEGIGCGSGYRPLNNMQYLKNAFQSKNFQKVYPKEMLDFDGYVERNQCPENDRLCNEEAIWFSQKMLLGNKTDMDDIANAIEKVYNNAEKIKEKI